jgi:gliding motility-associated-like protein
MNKFLILFLFLCNIALGQSPKVKFFALKGCAPFTTSMQDTTTYLSKTVANRKWLYGDGLSLNNINDTTSHVYYASGFFTIRLVVTFTDGTIDSTTFPNIFEVYPQPTIKITQQPKVGCSPLNVCFTNLSTYNCGGADTTIIDYGDGYIEKKILQLNDYFCHKYTSSGIFNTKFIMKNSCGCIKDTLYTNAVTVYQTPKVIFNSADTLGCSTPYNSQFYNYSISPIGTTYLWSFGDGTTSNFAQPIHTYTASNPAFTVRLVATSPNGCKDTMTKINFVKVVPIVSNFTVSKYNVCAYKKDTLQFTLNAPGNIGIYWDFGDGTNSTDTAPRHAYTSAGIFTAKLYVSYNVIGKICQNIITKNIFSDNKPTAIFNCPKYFCKGSSTICTNLSTNAVSYLWQAPWGIPYSSSNVNQTFNLTQTQDVRLIAFSTYGCSDTFIKMVYQSDVIRRTYFEPIGGCDSILVKCLDTSKLIDPTDSIIFKGWDLNNDGVFDRMGDTASKKFYYDTVKCTKKILRRIISMKGCVHDSIIEVGVGVKIRPNFYINNIRGCKNNVVDVRYTGDSAKHCKANFSQRWGYSGLTSANDITYFKDTPIVIREGGVKNILFTFKNSLNQCVYDTSFYLQLDLRGPYSGYDAKISCVRNDKRRINIINQSSYADSIWWIFDKVVVSRDPNLTTYVFQTYGKHTLMQVTYNKTYNCWDTLQSTLSVYRDIAGAVEKKNICVGSRTLLFDNSPDKYITQWTSFGPTYDTYHPSGYSILTADTAKIHGLYSYVLTSMDTNRCFDTLHFDNYTLANRIKGRLFVDTPLCKNRPLNFFVKVDSSILPIKSHIFNPGSGPLYFDTALYFQHAFTTPGFNTVVSKISDEFGCFASIIKIINIIDISASFAFSRDSICPGQDINFANFSTDTNLIYKWGFEDATPISSTSKTPSNIVFNSLGNKKVYLKVTHKKTGCSDSISKTIHVVRMYPNFFTDKSSAFCNATTVCFFDSSVGNITKYIWDFGDGSGPKQSTRTPCYIYLYPGNYFIKLIVESPSGCRDSVIKNAFNLKGPIANYKLIQTDSCEIAKMVLEVNTAFDTFLRVITGVGPPIDINHIPGLCGGSIPFCKDTFHFTLSSKGPYTPQIFVADAGCNYFLPTKTTQVNIYNRPKANFGISDSVLCLNKILTLTDSSTFKDFYSKNYVWNIENTIDTSIRNLKILLPKVGMNNVKLKVYSTPTCVDSISKNIRALGIPDVNYSLIDTCININVPFKNPTTPNGIVKFYWNFGDGGIDSLNFNTNRIYTTSNTYNTSLRMIDTNRCENIKSVPLFIQKKPMAINFTDVYKCVEDTIVINLRGGLKYVSNIYYPNGYLLDDSTYKTWYQNDFIYQFELLNPGCKTVANSMNLKVVPVNVIEIKGDPTSVDKGNSTGLSFISTFPSTNIVWYPTDKVVCNTCTTTSSNPIYENTKFIAEITYIKNGMTCKSKDDIWVKIDSINIDDIFNIPNVFSPNGDGLNDDLFSKLKGQGLILEEYEMIVFNRWGQEIFYTNDINKSWNGRFNDIAQPVGTYILFIHYKLKGRDKKSISRPLTLIR